MHEQFAWEKLRDTLCVMVLVLKEGNLADTIYQMRWSLKFYRNRLLHVDVPNEEWDHEPHRVNACIMAGEQGRRLEEWTEWNWVRNEPGKMKVEDWDIFPEEGGILSAHAIEVLRPYYEGRFVPMPATVEGQPFFFLCSIAPIDCLNVRKSKLEHLPSGMLIDIKEHVFYRDRVDDPAIFTFPQSSMFLFATESLPAVVRKEKLKGFDFIFLDGEPPPGRKKTTKKK